MCGSEPRMRTLIVLRTGSGCWTTRQAISQYEFVYAAIYFQFDSIRYYVKVLFSIQCILERKLLYAKGIKAGSRFHEPRDKTNKSSPASTKNKLYNFSQHTRNFQRHVRNEWVLSEIFIHFINTINWTDWKLRSWVSKGHLVWKDF